MKTAEQIKDELWQVKQELSDAVEDIERLLWLSGLCKYCAKGKGKGTRQLDRPCQVCEPKWRGAKKRRITLWKD